MKNRVKLNLESILNEKIPDGGLCAGQYRMTNVGNIIYEELKRCGYSPLFVLKDMNSAPLKFGYIEIKKPIQKKQVKHTNG